jgi:multiple sugar transport system permease protein
MSLLEISVQARSWLQKIFAFTGFTHTDGSNWRRAQGRFFTTLLVPSLVLLTAVTVLPVLYLISTAFTSWDLSRPDSLKFIWFNNFVQLFTQDERFWHSIGVQIRYTLLTVPFQVLIGLTLATFIKNRLGHSWLAEIVRAIFIIPMVIPPIVAGIIWKIMFTPQVSILNYLVVSAGGDKLAWLGDPNLALVAMAIANVWEFFPFCFLILFAGLQSLPEEPFEAARVDGASGWQIFRYVTLPMLRPVLTIVILFQLVDSIRAFPLVFIMTDGGPGFATEPTNYYAYQKAFNYSYIGYSSAMIVIMLIFTLFITYFILRSIKWSRGTQA